MTFFTPKDEEEEEEREEEDENCNFMSKTADSSEEGQSDYSAETLHHILVHSSESAEAYPNYADSAAVHYNIPDRSDASKALHHHVSHDSESAALHHTSKGNAARALYHVMPKQISTEVDESAALHHHSTRNAESARALHHVMPKQISTEVDEGYDECEDVMEELIADEEEHCQYVEDEEFLDREQQVRGDYYQ